MREIILGACFVVLCLSAGNARAVGREGTRPSGRPAAAPKTSQVRQLGTLTTELHLGEHALPAGSSIMSTGTRKAPALYAHLPGGSVVTPLGVPLKQFRQEVARVTRRLQRDEQSPIGHALREHEREVRLTEAAKTRYSTPGRLASLLLQNGGYLFGGAKAAEFDNPRQARIFNGGTYVGLIKYFPDGRIGVYDAPGKTILTEQVDLQIGREK